MLPLPPPLPKQSHYLREPEGTSLGRFCGEKLCKILKAQERSAGFVDNVSYY